MDEKDLIYNLTQEIKKSTKSYQQSQELAHKDSLIVAENGFLEIWSRAKSDYSNIKLAYFKGEITAEQFKELSNDVRDGMRRIAIAEFPGCEEGGHAYSLFQTLNSVIKEDVAKATGNQDEKE